jgi:succinoglycan biosynthesis protein ExoA
MSNRPEKPFVSIIIPTYNEERYILDAINSLVPLGDGLNYEIQVIDGGSTDRTSLLVAELAKRNCKIKLLDNPKKWQAAAVNIGACNAHPSTQVILRADAHSTYPKDYVEYCFAELKKIGAASLVVPVHAVGTTCFQKAVAAALNSKLGNGGAPHRGNGGQPRFVDHGHHAAFNRRFFLSVGGYDESFSHNEDAELDIRIGKAGGRIWLEPNATVTYFPRSNVIGLAVQYFRNGRGRAKTFFKHRPRLKLRQLAPLVILYGCGGGFAMALASPWFLMIPVAYVVTCLGWGFASTIKSRDLCLMAMGMAAMTMHFSWAAGFSVGIVRELVGVSREGTINTRPN